MTTYTAADLAKQTTTTYDEMNDASGYGGTRVTLVGPESEDGTREQHLRWYDVGSSGYICVDVRVNQRRMGWEEAVRIYPDYTPIEVAAEIVNGLACNLTVDAV